MTQVKALGLLSGGLDSILATEIIQKQGIQVIAFNVKSPFCLCKKNGCAAVDAAKQLNVPLKMVAAKEDYLRMLKNLNTAMQEHESLHRLQNLPIQKS
jgi:tRNA U34 2-thiouridine synthase MnmA/TrmU